MLTNGRTHCVQEGSTLQSALCTALSSTGCPWPAVLPVHDPLRDACWGAAVTASGTTAFFDSDSVHTSIMPEKLLQVRCAAFLTVSLKGYLIVAPVTLQKVAAGVMMVNDCLNADFGVLWACAC